MSVTCFFSRSSKLDILVLEKEQKILEKIPLHTPKKKIISWNILTQYGQNFVDTKHFKNKKKSKQRDMLDT